MNVVPYLTAFEEMLLWAASSQQPVTLTGYDLPQGIVAIQTSPHELVIPMYAVHLCMARLNSRFIRTIQQESYSLVHAPYGGTMRHFTMTFVINGEKNVMLH